MAMRSIVLHSNAYGNTDYGLKITPPRKQSVYPPGNYPRGDNGRIQPRKRRMRPMSLKKLTRRELLKIGAAMSAAEFAALLPGCGGGKTSPGTPAPSSCSKLTDIEHVVILIQENRSFDHYFGSYRGVHGFSDQSMAFQQPDPANTSGSP